ncbi:hypothetical protein ADUPG1_000642, partial [Aduncisulcus paluster]
YLQSEFFTGMMKLRHAQYLETHASQQLTEEMPQGSLELPFKRRVYTPLRSLPLSPALSLSASPSLSLLSPLFTPIIDFEEREHTSEGWNGSIDNKLPDHSDPFALQLNALFPHSFLSEEEAEDSILIPTNMYQFSQFKDPSALIHFSRFFLAQYYVLNHAFHTLSAQNLSSFFSHLFLTSPSLAIGVFPLCLAALTNDDVSCCVSMGSILSWAVNEGRRQDLSRAKLLVGKDSRKEDNNILYQEQNIVMKPEEEKQDTDPVAESLPKIDSVSQSLGTKNSISSVDIVKPDSNAYTIFDTSLVQLLVSLLLSPSLSLPSTLKVIRCVNASMVGFGERYREEEEEDTPDEEEDKKKKKISKTEEDKLLSLPSDSLVVPKDMNIFKSIVEG